MRKKNNNKKKEKNNNKNKMTKDKKNKNKRNKKTKRKRRKKTTVHLKEPPPKGVPQARAGRRGASPVVRK